MQPTGACARLPLVGAVEATAEAGKRHEAMPVGAMEADAVRATEADRVEAKADI